MSISDPGNTDSVITVGSTHRSDPHRHGVELLLEPRPDRRRAAEARPARARRGHRRTRSGRRRLGDARHKPGGSSCQRRGGDADGALSRVIGRPERIKEILCGTATDLGRERAFQGNGLVDVLRAMQSV